MVHIFCDGASKNNPGPASIGAVAFLSKDSNFSANLRDYKEEKIESAFEISQRIGEKTNNQAEYLAVIAALEAIQSKFQSESTIKFYLDSKLVVEQLNGNWKVKNENMKNLFLRCQQLLVYLNSKFNIKFIHVKREKNTIADHLANQAFIQPMKAAN